jgi:hypothetical protein
VASPIYSRHLLGSAQMDGPRSRFYCRLGSKRQQRVADRKPFDRDRRLPSAASWQDIKFGGPSILLCGRNNRARSCYARA